MRKHAVVSFAVGFILLSLFCRAQTGKVENIGTLTDGAVPEAVRQTLDAKGYRLKLDDTASTCELWIRKSVPAQTKKDLESVAYPQLAESTLVGVIHFSQAADFRGHRIPAGFNTLRYELMPNDGNHLGAAPNRDFLLVVPAASDGDPGATFTFQELVTMSASTTGTKHPSPLSLVQADAEPSTPAVSKDDQDHWTFSGGMRLSAGEELSFALVVKETAQQ